jgi:DNA polymerase-3 subunit gamma/tau
LKTVEEPPANVIFVMATTELHKVPETITSRCQEFQFRTISVQKIFDRLKLIAEAEKIDISDDALRELARSGEGSMRDAQSNFDQVISFSGDKIGPNDVTNALGFAGVEILTKTINAIAARDPKAVLAVVDDLIARGHDLRNFCRDVLGLFRDLLVFKVAGEEAQLYESAVFSGEQMRSLAEPFSEPDLVRFFNSLCETEASLREAAHPRYVLEIGLVKLIEMRSVADIESILQRLDAISSGASMPARPDAEFKSASASGNPFTEKKTLKTEPPAASIERKTAVPPAPRETVDVEPPDDTIGADADETSFAGAPTIAPEPSPVFSAATTYPVRLPPLSSLELEHVDEPKLDDAYEQMLAISGDDLKPIAGIERLVEVFIGRPASAPSNISATNGSSAGTAAARAPIVAPQAKTSTDMIDLPELSDEPSEDELLAYARAHPSVQAAMRIFRAKVVKVSKK